MKQGWEIKKLGECFEFIKNGANIKQKRGASGIPITRIETLSGGVFNRDRLGYADIESLGKYKSYVMESDDLLLSHINSKTYIGRVVVYEKEVNEVIIHGMNLLRMKVVPELLSPYYFYYYSQTHNYRSQIANRRKDAVNQSSISVSDLKTIKIPVPPLAEQERIVAELDCLSGVIEKKKQQLKELDALAQSIFDEMFGDPITNEKGWEVKKLGEISIKISNGYNAKLEENTYKQYGIPYFRCQNIWWNRIDYNDIVYIDEKTNEIMKSSTLMKYDLIISKIGRVYTENSSLFRTAIYEGEDRKANISGNLCYVRLNKSIIPKFILGILTQEKYRNWAKINTPGGIDKRAMSITQISNLPIILPPLSLQQSFASKIEAIEKQKELIKQSIKEVETLFNSRMDYYFN